MRESTVRGLEFTREGSSLVLMLTSDTGAEVVVEKIPLGHVDRQKLVESLSRAAREIGNEATAQAA